MYKRASALAAAAALVGALLSACTFSGSGQCTTAPNGVITCTATPSPTGSQSTAPTSPSPTPTPTSSPTATQPTPTPTSTTTPPGPTPSASATPSSTATPTPSATPTASLSNLARIPWAGGNSYWTKFPAAGKMNNPNLFPVSVFFGKPEHAAALKDIGVNVYQEAEHDGSTMASITNTGMLVIAGTEWTRAEVGNNPGVIGWNTYDECDMGLGCSGSNTQENLAQMKQLVSKIRAWGDGRAVMANYSKGVLGTYWASGTMDDFLAAVDFASVDNYMYTGSGWQFEVNRTPDWPNDAPVQRAAAYGWQIDQMRKFQASPGVQPNWIFVESARPYLGSTGRTITPEQMEGAIWSGIIHGAEGVSIFQHNDDPKYGNYSLVDIPADRKAKIKAALTKVQSLAPVLNTQSYVWNTGAAKMDTMLKAKDGHAYLFAGVGLEGTTGAKTFTLPAGITGTQVEVVGEGRTLTVQGGKITDTFANEYTHHVYKVAL